MINADDKARVKVVRSSSYEEGHATSEKVWYAMIGSSLDTICAGYLVALLTAHAHRKPFPHLAQPRVYKGILSLEGEAVLPRKPKC